MGCSPHSFFCIQKINFSKRPGGESKQKNIKSQSFMTVKSNPIHHTQKIKAQMHQLINHLREDIGKVTEPKVQALFETSAEVLTGLAKAFDDYEKKNETAWQTEPAASRPIEKIT
jgi:hypothetical protein